MNSFNSLALIFISLTAFTSVNGLRCFNCNSLSKPYCSDPYDPPDTGALALEYQADCDKEIEKVVRNETNQIGLTPHIGRNGSQYVAVCRKVVQKVTVVNGLECWMCKGNINSGCNSPFIDKLFAKKKCDENEKVCLKITQNVNGEVFNIRKCGVLDPSIVDKPESMGCKDVSDKGLPTVEECICNTDGCNGSSQLTALSSTTILIPILLGFLLLA